MKTKPGLKQKNRFSPEKPGNLINEYIMVSKKPEKVYAFGQVLLFNFTLQSFVPNISQAPWPKGLSKPAE